MEAVRKARTGGWLAVAAGLLGTGVGATLLLAPPAVPAELFNHPFDPATFAWVQALLFLHHLMMAGAMWLYGAAGLAGRSRFATVAIWWAVVAIVFLAAWELVAIGGAGQPYPSDETAWLDVGYSIGNFGTGIGLILVGVATTRARVLSGLSRWIVLITGVYMFVPMAPALFAGFVVGRLVLIVWMLLFAAVGWAMLTWAARERERVETAAAARARAS